MRKTVAALFNLRQEAIHDVASAAGELDTETEKTLVEAKACYTAFTRRKDEAFLFRKTVLHQDRRKRFDVPSQSSGYALHGT
jgi:hypothetical protein